jgi:hypothetical protein
MASRYHFAPSQPSIGGLIGSALGTGLGTGLTRLAESKLDVMLNRQKQGQLVNEFVKMGIPEQQAAFLAKQSPETQWQTVRQWWMSQGYDGGDLPGSIHEDWEATPSPLQELSTQEQPRLAGPQQGAVAAIDNMGQQKEAMQGAAMQALTPQVPQAPVAPPTQPAPIPPMPKQRKARDLGEAFRMAEEATPKTAKEKKIPDAAIKRSETAIDTANQMEGIANEMIALIDTGKVGSGIAGYAPTVLQGDESQQFDALSNELASLLASRSGVATNFKIKLAQSMKPNLRQSTKTQRKLAEKIIETSKELRTKAEERIGSTSEGSAKQEIKANTTGSQNLFESLPNPAQYKGRKILDEKTGQVLISDGSSWKKE